MDGMTGVVRVTGKVLGTAGTQVLSNNIECYENTIPNMLTDRLRNSKFSGPECPQTGVAAEWETRGNGMQGMVCKLVPGQYLSGRESQMIQNFMEHDQAGILQVGVPVRAGERFEVELWARAQYRPVEVTFELKMPGQSGQTCTVNVDQAHWHRVTCEIESPGEGDATFFIVIPGDSRLIIDQVHLRPVGEGPVSQALLDAFDQFPCPVLRFPGGCASCTYHWEHSVGPVHLRPVVDDPVFKYKMHYDFGTDEYLQLCVDKGMRPFITLNTTTATPEDAVGWAAYIRAWYLERDLPVPAAYFGVGNENYGTWELGHMTGQMYVEQLRAFVPGLREVYPEARIAAIGEFSSKGLRDAYTTPWRSLLLEVPELFDMLIVTRYAWGSDDGTMAEKMAAVADRVGEKREDLSQQVQTIRDSGLDCTMGIVEWNYWTRASHNDHEGFFEPNDIRHCLYGAGLINSFCRLGEILEVANYYSLVNTMGMIHSHIGEVEYSDMVKVMNLYADALPGEVLDVEVDAPMVSDSNAALDACFLRKDDKTYGFLVHFGEQDLTVNLESVGKIEAATGITADDILVPVETYTPATEGTTVTLKPRTVVRVICN